MLYLLALYFVLVLYVVPQEHFVPSYHCMTNCLHLVLWVLNSILQLEKRNIEILALKNVNINRWWYPKTRISEVPWVIAQLEWGYFQYFCHIWWYKILKKESLSAKNVVLTHFLELTLVHKFCNFQIILFKNSYHNVIDKVIHITNTRV